MKKVIVSMLMLGFISLGFSQEPNEMFSTVALDNVNISSTNANYLSLVSDKNTPKVVKRLQEKAASYDVRSKAGFDKKSKKPFEVIFKASNGDIIVFYNKKGEIISAREHFTDVVIPLEVRKRASQGNNGWTMSDNKYVSLYHNKALTKKIFKIQLRNRDLRKKLIIDILK